ncbi:MOSC domain-containing protein [Bacillus suaedaesalsae]|uniref:MOSC domain-containing protein n=1 Tax=Bacillus suaedaesalsae TaxID=2810349 RepID=A0ABS2DLL8_9BACI|nr:MOSC domain-containing protein [Bacillus suaedaesalsae]MBM6619287.1 MOSC domain-containing protein [Bacillus suaedaesalsae]
MMKLVSLNIGKPNKIQYKEHFFTSGVGKQYVEKAFLTKNGFKDDGVEQIQFHGGPDRAVLLYCYEHYKQWKQEFGKELVVPGFGENLTVSGLSEATAHIGDVYQVGDAMIQITQARIPCNTLSKYNGLDKLLGRLVETGYTGFLGRVLKEGWIMQNSPIVLKERLPHSMSVLKSNELYFHDKNNVKDIKKLLAIEELADIWKEKLKSRIHNLG